MPGAQVRNAMQPRSNETNVTSIFREMATWPSPDRVVRVLGAYAATLSRARSPGQAAYRHALGTAAALGEMVAATWRPELSIHEIDIRADPGALAARSGLSVRETTDALDLLHRAGVIVRAGATHVRLDAQVLDAHPTLARVAWDEVRQRLDAAACSVACALAIVREVAAVSPPPDPDGACPHVEFSQDDLSSRTRWQRTALTAARRALTASGVLGHEERSGRPLALQLLPPAFGLGAARVEAPAVKSSAAAVPRPPDPHPAEGVLVYHYHSTPIHLPSGTPMQVAIASDGSQVITAGPLRIEIAPDGSETAFVGPVRLPRA